MDMMINIVSPEAVAMPSAEAGSGAQTSGEGVFGQILNAQLSGQTLEETSCDTAAPASDEDTLNTDVNAAAAVMIAQFMQASASDMSGVNVEQTTAVVSQATDAQRPDSVRMTIPIATDGGPYNLQTPVQTITVTGQPSAQDDTVSLETGGPVVVTPTVNEPVINGVDAPAGVVSETKTAQTEDQAAVNVKQPSADQAADVTDLNPVFRTAIRQAMGEEAAGVPQQQVDSDQPAVDPTVNTVKDQSARSQEASNAQQPVEAAVNPSSSSPAASQVRTDSGEGNRVRLEGNVTTEAVNSESKVDGASSAADSGAGDSPSFNFASQGQVRVSSSDTTQTAGSDSRTEAYTEVQQRVIDQVVREVKLRRFDQGGEIIMRLDPPELGTMRVRITQDAGIMTGHISASSDQVKGLLQAHLSTLVDALSEAGVKMDSVSVSTGMPSGTPNHDGAAGSFQGNFNGSRRRFTASGASASAGALTGAAGAFTTNNNVGYSWLA